MRFIVGLMAVATASYLAPLSVHAAEAAACRSAAATVSFSPEREPCALSAAEEASLRPKDVFRECAEGCPEMIVVPSGSFTMGSPEDEKGRGSDEGPQHRVTIAHAFAVGRFAVTFVEWDACVSDGGCGGYRPDDNGWGRSRLPVINVSWDDAKAYLKWLSKKTGHEYRLLSEAEREYVARAGTTTPFWWGSSITAGQANYYRRETRNGGAKGESPAKTLPVGSFEANPFGLYDVHGNVSDWVEDCYHDSYAGAPTDGSAWTAGDCSRRAFRGGSWSGVPPILRAAKRDGFIADFRDDIVGFRVARTLPP